MEIKRTKKIVELDDKGGVKVRTEKIVNEAFFTKKKAADDLKDLYEFLYDLIGTIEEYEDRPDHGK